MKDQDLCNLLNRHQGPIGQVEVCREAAERIAQLSAQGSLASPQVTDEQILTLLQQHIYAYVHSVTNQSVVIKGQEEFAAALIALLSAPPAAETNSICQHCNSRYPLHDLECPVAVEAISKAASQEAKPVAWRYEYRDIYRGRDTGWTIQYSTTEPTGTLKHDGTGVKNITPLFAASSQEQAPADKDALVLALKTIYFGRYRRDIGGRLSDTQMADVAAEALRLPEQRLEV